MFRIRETGVNLPGDGAGEAAQDAGSPPPSFTANAQTSASGPHEAGLTASERQRHFVSSLNLWRDQSQLSPVAIEAVTQRLKTSFDQCGSRIRLADLGLTGPLPPSIRLMDRLASIDLQHNRLTENDFPAWLADLPQLQSISASENNLHEIPRTLLSLPNLHFLSLSQNHIQHVAPQIADCQALSCIVLSRNSLTELPPELFLTPAMQQLHVDGNALSTLPLNVGLAQKLRVLDLSDNRLRELPESFYAHSPEELMLGLDNTPLSVATWIKLNEWVSTAPNAGGLLANMRMVSMRGGLARTLALPEGAEELSDLASLEDMRLKPLSPDALDFLQNFFPSGDPRHDLLTARLAILGPSPDARRLESIAANTAPWNTPEACALLAIKPESAPLHPDFQKELLAALRSRQPASNEQADPATPSIPLVPLPEPLREALLQRFSSYELLEGLCRIAMRLSPDDPALDRLEPRVQDTLGKLGAGPFSQEHWRAHFGPDPTNTLVAKGFPCIAWLKQQAATVIDDPLFGARGYSHESAPSRGRFMDALRRLQQATLASEPRPIRAARLNLQD